ncbi:Tryptophan--tRNA ligase 2 [Anaerococcus prevotii]|uniref:Tryptophan--tRNA ligase n=1 Tax=Anaerococcus prevotii (strain ATCC 9321 / DSM 20548 / JCM 6508 / NCTC 11806 / PC1) TaxID=525919 RepID=C7RDK8_ANAPD|nr:tryptophan--tRNA ligase [Anaerococcus prevotii]ACV29271.1 tryptophanyl-tRNA synthetase [Anaerococcus prevotii DSM 20548]SUU94946.1 Tryptophan--tRNA ligase 2 [Anaerococcus prevotii]
MKDIILTGDRPTGRLHLGHYVGSLKNRVIMQNEGNYDRMYIMIADSQALTDNFDDPGKIRENLIEVALDYLSVGLDPEKVTFFVQSQVSELTELTFYFLNLVTLSRLERNPTVKSEIKLRDFETSLPAGFLIYPVSQAADILLFDANIVPVGEDQEPMLEQAREIARSFNHIYGETFVEPKAVLPEAKIARRMPGIDGGAKMSKSLGNAIYLADDKKTVKKKVMSMYTDPDHINIEDPGKVEGNIVFTYLDVFSKPEHFKEFLPEYENLEALKDHYRRGGLGDVKVKKFLIKVLEDELEPIRKRRAEYEKDLEKVFKILEEGTAKAREAGRSKVEEVKKAMGINYFEDEKLVKSLQEKYK